MALIPYKELQKSEFFGFFNIHETERQASGQGLVVLHFKPGGSQEFIDIEMHMDENDGIVEAIVLLDRAWIGGTGHVNVFANDIAKSFIDALVPADDHGAIEPLVAAIMDTRGSGDRVIALQPQRQQRPALDGAGAKALAVYTGTVRGQSLILSRCEITLENVTLEGKDRLRVRVQAKHD